MTKCTATSSGKHNWFTRLVGGKPYDWCGYCGELPTQNPTNMKENK